MITIQLNDEIKVRAIELARIFRQSHPNFQQKFVIEGVDSVETSMEGQLVVNNWLIENGILNTTPLDTDFSKNPSFIDFMLLNNNCVFELKTNQRIFPIRDIKRGDFDFFIPYDCINQGSYFGSALKNDGNIVLYKFISRQNAIKYPTIRSKRGILNYTIPFDEMIDWDINSFKRIVCDEVEV